MGLLQDVARNVGLHVERIRDGKMKWNQGVELNFPVDVRSRWGYGLPSNPFISDLLRRQRANYEPALRDLETCVDFLHSIPREQDANTPQDGPYWNNTWFSGLDAASLSSFLIGRRPKRYLEIGSGFSTRFSRRAVREAGLDTVITSVDPQPRAEIDALCDRVIRKPLESCTPELFDELERGDILFFDGSHRTLPNSDATVFFLDVLPRLKAGVLIHVHDIFLPDDYPPEWSKRVYSEEYLLASMLLLGADKIRILFPAYFVATDPALKDRIGTVFASRDGKPGIPMKYNMAATVPACSFWFEILHPPQ